MPRVVDRSARRQQLIHAALVLFSERGYHGATMQAVAERAGVSKGGIYDYFNSKEELLTSTAEVLLSALFENSLGAFENSRAPIRKKIASFVRSLLAGVDQWNDLVFAIAQAWAELGREKDQPLNRLMADIYRQSADRLQAVLDRAVADEEARPFPTRAAALSLIAALDGLMLQSSVVNDEFRAALETDCFVDWCCSIVPLEETETP